MTNIGPNAIETISTGDKIAQLVIAPVPMIKWEEGTIDDNTERGEGGFGSTDNKN
jgi:dUTP pyrophosphatase